MSSPAQTIEERLAPHRLDAEKAVLGSIMLQGTLYEQATAILTAEDFYLEAHRHIFRAMSNLSLQEHSEAIDLVTISDAVKAVAGSADEVGGKAYLSSLIDGLPRYSNIESYARIVSEKASLRRLIETGTALMNSAYADDGQGAIEIAERAMTSLGDIVSRGSGVKLRTMAEAEKDIHGDLEYFAERMAMTDEKELEKSDKFTLPCPYSDLQRFRPFMRGAQTIVGARTSMGKSMFAIDLELKLARKGFRVAHFTNEDLERNIRFRLVSNISGVPFNALWGKLSQRDFDRVAQAQDELVKLPIALNTNLQFSPGQLFALARDHHRRHGLDLLVVDYIQNFNTAGEQRYLALGDIARQTRALAAELNCCALVTAQLGRAAAAPDKNGKYRRPTKEDLKESGDIEQGADTILLLHRESYFDSDQTDMGETEVLVDKNKNGPRGFCELFFNGQCQRVRDIRTVDNQEVM